MRNMGISQGSGEKPPPPEQLLDTVDFDGIANYMNSERCKRVITMAGAGISTCQYISIPHSRKAFTISTNYPLTIPY